MSGPLKGTQLRAVVAESLRTAARASDTLGAPVAVLWPDPERAWTSAIRALQEAVPVLVLGEWTGDPDQARGPALWLRAVLADPSSLELPAHLAARDPEHPAKTPWVLYLPGVKRHELADLTNLPEHLAPLAEVAIRSVWWTPSSGQEAWTPHSFLASKQGAGLDLARDAATKRALSEVLPRLLDEEVDELRRLGRLDAERLHSLIVRDPVRSLLEWIDDPATARQRMAGAEWNAFAASCRSRFGLDPDKDTPISAAALLGARSGDWRLAWDRFTEAPSRYPNLPAVLDQARPQETLLDEQPHPDSWPSWNREQEDLLRSALLTLGGAPDAGVVLESITRLEAEHARRRESVWAALDQSPLAGALGLLAQLATATSDLSATGTDGAVAWYAARGRFIDDLALRVLAAPHAERDREATRTALHAVYDPWVDRNARTFQTLVQTTGYPGATGLDADPGTCVVYVDALRLDLGHRLAALLPHHDVEITTRLAAFPTVTPTGQPAVAPVARSAREGWGAGTGFEVADAHGRAVKGSVLQSTLSASGVQVLPWNEVDTGDPSGIAWIQTNDIDSAGHAQKGARFEDVVDSLLTRVAARVTGLLEAGWARVIVVTDHGFLYPALPAEKVELSLAVTEEGVSRKPRVARLRDGAPALPFPTTPWTWDPGVRMVSAPGASAFEAGTRYEHGGLSPQECITPVITVTRRLSASEKMMVAIIGQKWTGQRCRIDIAPASTQVTVELRTYPGDAASAVTDPKAPNAEGEVKVLVDEDRATAGTALHVVVLDDSGAVVAQNPTTVGGDP